MNNYTFYFNPHEVTHRFDAIVAAHFAHSTPPSQQPALQPCTTLSLSTAKAQLIAIRTQIEQLKRTGAAIRESLHGPQRQALVDEHAEQQRHIEALLTQVGDPRNIRTIRRLTQKRRTKRKRLLEVREQRRQSDASEAVTHTMDAPAEQNTHHETTPEDSSRMKAAAGDRRLKRAQTYRTLCERLEELYKVRCQQATRQPAGAFLAEIETLRRLWGEALQHAGSAAGSSTAGE